MSLIELLKKEWDSQGECRSCGYHGSLNEYYLDEEELKQELKEEGYLWFPCVNPEGDTHRGVKIYFSEPPQKESEG